MKKLLACILAIALLLSSAVAATAALSAGEAEIAPHGLVFELPVVTGIEAEWNGEVLLNLSVWRARFSPENVDVTVHFADGSSEQLTRWNDRGMDWWWQLGFVIDDETNIVTIFYEDSNLRSAFAEANGLELWQVNRNNANYLATLPQDSFELPANYHEIFVDGFRPITALTLNEAVTTTVYNFFTFTPETSGLHRFYGGGPFSVVVLNADFEVQARLIMWPVFGEAVWLEAGQTYYALVMPICWDSGPPSPEGEFNLIVTDNVPPPPPQPSPTLWQRIVEWFRNAFLWIDNVLWDLAQNMFGRIVMAPFMLLFAFAAFPIFTFIQLFNWIRWGW